MEKRIELEKRGAVPDQVTDLNLDNCRSTCIEGLTDDFVNLKSLSMNSVGLTSLKGFPKLPNLTKLELSDNRISSGLNLLSTSPSLTYLNLSGNKIKDLDTLTPLKDFEHLRTLDLFHNEVTGVENYREKIFKLIPSLKYLDGFDMKEEQEESDAGEPDVYSVTNGNEDDDSDEFDDEEEDVEEEELGLDAVYKDNLDEESEGEDYLFGSEEEDEDIAEEEESSVQETDEDATPRGKKRKHEGEEETN